MLLRWLWKASSSSSVCGQSTNVSSTYFELQGRFFEQMDGAAMGSPLSPVVANLFMEAFESRALEEGPYVRLLTHFCLLENAAMPKR